MIRFACPRCKAVLEAPDPQAGSKVACPKCQQRLQIPLPPKNKTILAPLVEHRSDPGISQPKRAGVRADSDSCSSPPPARSRRDRVPGSGVDPETVPLAELVVGQEPNDEQACKQAAPRLRANQWAMFIHFSLLSGHIVPVAGWVVPIILWQMKKKEMPEIDAHGKFVCNWIITSVLYAIILVVVIMIPLIGCIGLVPLFVGAILGIVYPIIGGIKANDGILWVYPGTITFLK